MESTNKQCMLGRRSGVQKSNRFGDITPEGLSE